MNLLNLGAPPTAALPPGLPGADAAPVLPSPVAGDVAGTDIASDFAADFGAALARLLGGDEAAPAQAAEAAPEGEDTPADDATDPRDSAGTAPAPALLTLLLPVTNAVPPQVQDASNGVSDADGTGASGLAGVAGVASAAVALVPAAESVPAPAATPASEPASASRPVAAAQAASVPDPAAPTPANRTEAASPALPVPPAMPTGEGVAARADAASAVPTSPVPADGRTALSAPAAKQSEQQTAPAASGIPAGDALAQAAGAPSAARASEPLKLANGAPTQWRQPLLQALGERIQLQLGRHSESAVIRLDPPQMGRIEIAIRHEAGALTVNLSATHNEVLRQLQGIGESLRHDLSQRSQGEVTVQVAETPAARGGGEFGGDGRQRGRQSAPQENQPGQALAEAETRFDAAAFGLAAEQE